MSGSLSRCAEKKKKKEEAGGAQKTIGVPITKEGGIGDLSVHK